MMENSMTDINEQKARAAFTKQSAIFDEIYSGNSIITYKRERVRRHVLQFIQPGCSILELNAGTGEDATWFAKHGYTVHATDIAEGMQKMLKKKIHDQQLESSITTELCSFTQLEHLENRGPFDFIFSNFAGLNCTPTIEKVLSSLPVLLKDNGVVTMVIMPKFCLWEALLVFKGKFKTAGRRLFSKKGASAHIDGEYFTCWYYNPSDIIKKMPADFDLLSVEGLCTIVPPSYIEFFAERHPRLYSWLKKKEKRYKSSWPWKSIGDYYMISLRKK
jgi:ubiquinone/menaquinone biosynthesis C-methylase UbiE